MRHVAAVLLFATCIAAVFASHVWHLDTSMDIWLEIGAVIAFISALAPDDK